MNNLDLYHNRALKVSSNLEETLAKLDTIQEGLDSKDKKPSSKETLDKLLDILLLFFLITFSFFIPFYYGNKGIFPIDTLGFFDSSYNILLGRHPIKDFWIFSGIFVDYSQALFF